MEVVDDVPELVTGNVADGGLSEDMGMVKNI